VGILFSALVMQPVIQPAELVLLVKSKPVVLIDASSGADAKEGYNRRHLPRALHVDLDRNLADIKPDPADGGRHPLPASEKFGKLLGSLGIAPQSHVLVYDNKNGANAASRFWWMLRAAGHKKVQVLSGSLYHAIDAGMPASASAETPVAVPDYPFSLWQLPLAGIDEVEESHALAMELSFPRQF
jgi:thiosulfate/3-mercaptopyruvate sulfurtransferase